MECWWCREPTDGARCRACGSRQRPELRRTVWWLVGIVLAATAVVVPTELLSDRAERDADDVASGEVRATDSTAGTTVARTTGTSSGPPTTSPTVEPEPDFAAIYSRTSTGVLPVWAVTCHGGGTGTGFLVDERTVVTAAHTVEGAVAVSVQVAGDPVSARVTALDTTLDVAVLRLGTDATGAVLSFAPTGPEFGDDVAALGYPDGGALRMTEGTVLDPDTSVLIEGDRQYGLVATDAATRPGNSGGPLLDAHGDVAGMVIAGTRDAPKYSSAVPATTLETAIPDLPPPEPVACDRAPLGPEGADVAGLPGPEELELAALARTFGDYFGGINGGDYALAYAQQSPRLQAGSTLRSFRDGVETSYDHQFDVRDVRLGADSAWVWLEFVSLQDPDHGPDGEGCTEWSLEYDLVRTAGGRYLIDDVRGHGGGPGHRPCAGW